MTEKALKSIGINTVKQLRQADPEELQNIFGNTTPRMLSLAKGIDYRKAKRLWDVFFSLARRLLPTETRTEMSISNH